MKNFNVEEQFLQYLKLVELDPAKLSRVQLTETKRPFMAGVTQMFTFFINSTEELSDEEGSDMIINLNRQLSDFWGAEVLSVEKQIKKTDC